MTFRTSLSLWQASEEKLKQYRGPFECINFTQETVNLCVEFELHQKTTSLVFSAQQSNFVLETRIF